MRVQSCPSLGDLMDCSLPGSSVHGIFQARLLEWVAIFSSRGSSQGLNPHLLHHFTLTGCILNSFSHLTLCNPMDCNLPSSSVHGFLQATILSGLPCPPHWQADFLPLIKDYAVSSWSAENTYYWSHNVRSLTAQSPY